MNKRDNSEINVLITGASGLIGSELTQFLSPHGFAVHLLQRTPSSTEPYWNIERQEIHLNGIPSPDVIIHLAGLNIGESRWTKPIKEEIVNSRINSTQLLVDYINNHKKPPSLFICASAIGFYGDSGQKTVDESSPVGEHFVSKLAEKWEQVSQKVKQANTRVVNLRSGIVLSKKGGALAKMLTPFKMGLGGRIGSGKQMMSWIDLQDEVNAILFIINNQQLSGPINLVSPNAVTNQNFSMNLAKVLNRPCLMPLPAPVVKLIFAQMGEELLLSSTNVQPTKLLQAGFKFKYASLEKSLKKQFE